MPSKLIFDMTKAFPNTVLAVIDQLRTACSTHGIGPQDVTVVALPSHAAIRNQLPATTTWLFGSSVYDAPALVSQALREMGGSSREILVLSFNPAVWALAKQPWGSLSVRAEHVFQNKNQSPILDGSARLSAPVTPLIMDGPEPAWSFEHVSSLDEALQTLEKALRLKGAVSKHTAIRQTTLRPLMGMVNQAKFFGSAASTRSSGMIAILMRIACLRGLVEAGGTEPGDLHVWLRGSEPHHQVLRHEAAGLDVRDGQGVRGKSPEESVSFPTRRAREPQKFTSDRFSAAIEKQKMGPFPVARPFVYQALERLAPLTLTLCQLVERAISTAQQELPSSQPWPAIAKVTTRQILRAGVAIDTRESVLADSWMSADSPVARLSADWKIRVEGEILLALFANEQVSGEDLTDVARSVWGASNAEAISKVQAVMRYLIQAGRLEEDGSGIFRVKRVQPSSKAIPAGDAGGQASPEEDVVQPAPLPLVQ